MNAWFKVLILAMCLFGAATCFFGCGGSSSDDSSTTTVTNTVVNTVTNTVEAPPAAPAASATGNWSGQFATAVPFSMVLVQNGDAITGSYSSQGFPGTVSGTVSGGNIALTVTVDTGGPDVVSQWTGTINSALNSASGSFTIIAGGGGNGNWTMSK